MAWQIWGRGGALAKAARRSIRYGRSHQLSPMLTPALPRELDTSAKSDPCWDGDQFAVNNDRLPR
jgi:hypothetical protein